MIPAIVTAVLVLSRVTAVVMTMPPTNTGALPGLGRLGLALTLTAALVPVAPQAPALSGLAHLFGAIVLEVVVGVAMGAVVSVVFSAIGVAGEAMGTTAGLNLSTMFDPMTLAQTGTLGVLAVWLGTGVFLGANLHLELLAILADSLRELPPGAIADPTAGAVVLVRTAGMALLHGIALAGPLLVFVFAVNLGISILGRMAPSLQLFFAVGPTLTLLASIVLLGIALPSVLSAWAWVVREGVFAAAEIASGAR